MSTAIYELGVDPDRDMAAFLAHARQYGHTFRPNRMWISPALFRYLGGRLPGEGKHGRKPTARERHRNRQRAMQRERRGMRWHPPAATWGEAARSTIADWFLSGQR